ncbi:MAG: hypothetical protein P4L81_00530 [Candidatus Pacebacteria bacterium]|nr:hypothetical protein [Candidatus Paceibacterota bacterium]
MSQYAKVILQGEEYTRDFNKDVWSIIEDYLFPTEKYDKVMSELKDKITKVTICIINMMNYNEYTRLVIDYNKYFSIILASDYSCKKKNKYPISLLSSLGVRNECRHRNDYYFTLIYPMCYDFDTIRNEMKLLNNDITVYDIQTKNNHLFNR